MKIYQTPNALRDISVKSDKQTQASLYRNNSTAMNFQSLHGSYSIAILFQEIDEQGKRIARSRNLRDLGQFKRLIKKALELMISDGYMLHVKQNWNEYGFLEPLTVIEVIDNKLQNLTDSVLNEQIDGLSILEMIGEIKGLLINLKI